MLKVQKRPNVHQATEKQFLNHWYWSNLHKNVSFLYIIYGIFVQFVQYWNLLKIMMQQHCSTFKLLCTRELEDFILYRKEKKPKTDWNKLQIKAKYDNWNSPVF